MLPAAYGLTNSPEVLNRVQRDAVGRGVLIAPHACRPRGAVRTPRPTSPSRAFQFLIQFLILSALLISASCSRKNEGVAARRENIVPVDVQAVATIEVDRTLPVVG